MTMAASLEARMPFMDHELAAFASRLPDYMRVRGKTTKWILRESMMRILPREILERQKVGFRVPVNEWFRGSMKDWLGKQKKIQELYEESEFKKNEIVAEIIETYPWLKKTLEGSR